MNKYLPTVFIELANKLCILIIYADVVKLSGKLFKYN